MELLATDQLQNKYGTMDFKITHVLLNGKYCSMIRRVTYDDIPSETCTITLQTKTTEW